MIFQTIIIVLIPFLLVAMVFFFRIVKPIRAIEEYTRKIQEEDKQAMLMIDSQDEIGSLSRNINNMVHFQQEKINRLQEEKSKLELTFSSMMEGVMVLDGEHKIEAFNKSMMDMIGVGSDDIIGRTPIEVLRNITLQDALNSFLEKGEPATAEIGIGIDQRVILEVSISAVKGLTGNGRKIMMVFHDITQLRKLETIRTDFVANVTHEIKTPLTAIIGFVQTLQEGAIEEKETAARFLTIISEHALRLNRLVDDLLTLSSIELGEVKLHPEKTGPEHAVQQALSVIEGKARAKGLTISQVRPDNLPPILADGDSVIQILVNVLDNAVKFTPAGSIAVTAAEEAGGYLMITIADTGVGIPRNEIPRLGERFYRVDKMRSRELGGTGLGLSIVKHLLLAQQGRMEVESKPGRGTTVKLFFPLFPK